MGSCRPRSMGRIRSHKEGVLKLPGVFSIRHRTSAGQGQSTVPGHLSCQFRQISDSGLGSVQASLEQHYFAFPRARKITSRVNGESRTFRTTLSAA